MLKKATATDPIANKQGLQCDVALAPSVFALCIFGIWGCAQCACC